MQRQDAYHLTLYASVWITEYKIYAVSTHKPTFFSNYQFHFGSFCKLRIGKNDFTV